MDRALIEVWWTGLDDEARTTFKQRSVNSDVPESLRALLPTGFLTVAEPASETADGVSTADVEVLALDVQQFITDHAP